MAVTPRFGFTTQDDYNQGFDYDYLRLALLAIEQQAQRLPIIVETTLTVAGWVGTSAPFTQAKTATGYVPASKLARNGFPAAATTAQLKEYGKCIIRMTSGATNSITFSADTKPTIDIPILIEIVDR